MRVDEDSVDDSKRTPLRTWQRPGTGADDTNLALRDKEEVRSRSGTNGEVMGKITRQLIRISEPSTEGPAAPRAVNLSFGTGSMLKPLCKA